MVGIIHQTQKNTAEAKRSYELALEASPDAAIAANNLAWILAEERQDLDRALMLAKRAAVVRPNDPQVSDTIGWIYYHKQLPTLAVPPFERAVSLNPENAEFQYHLGLAYAKVGNNAKARTHLQKALAIDAKFNGATEARGLLSSLGTN
jgi:tetratricopeptide (TPR) repeat protein